jgi:D-proline reductase (dithiol) PrdB
MEPIRYVERLNRFYQSQGFPPYDWTVNESAPLTPLRKPLSHCRVSLLTSGGISRRESPPWNPQARNDLRLDAIASDAPSDDFQVHDDYYDHRSVRQDLNCMFPIDRLRELAAEGVIASVAPRLWSGFMGRIYKRSEVVGEATPALARELRKDGVDLFVLVPACPLDHQTVGLVARVIEEAGIPTVLVSTGRDLTQQVRPPRSVFVNFPMGNAFGRPFAADAQRRILQDALELGERARSGGALVDLPYDWGESFGSIVDEAGGATKRA